MGWLTDVWRWMMQGKGRGRVKKGAEVVQSVTLDPEDVGLLDAGTTKRVKVQVVTSQGARDPSAVHSLTATSPLVTPTFEPPNTVVLTIGSPAPAVETPFDYTLDAL